jgi:tetratricopeptide (TPR) repeat protein
MATLKDILKKIRELEKANKFNELVEILSNKMISTFRSSKSKSELLSERAKAWEKMEQYDNAIKDYSEAIELKQTDAFLYFSRAYVFNCKKEVEKAIIDYNKAIELQPNDAVFYTFRSNSKRLAGKYDEAIKDCTQAIDLDPNYSYAYSARGRLFHTKGDYDNAIADLTKAIQLRPGSPYVYSFRGDAYSAKQQFDLALNDYEKVLQIDNEYKWVRSKIDEIKAKTGKIQDVKPPVESKVEIKLYFLIETIDNLNVSDDEKDQLKDIGNAFLQLIDKIIDYAFAKNSEPVVHYTKLKVADIIVSENDEPPLRYYNVVYMNDPEEGKVLFECLNDNNIKECFIAAKKEEDNNIFLGSFLPASIDKKNNYEDELIMWRTYGKDELKNEASGCSIIIRHDFFDQERHYLHEEMNKGKFSKAVQLSIMEKESLLDSESKDTQALYSVLYYDKRQKRFVGSKKKELNAAIKELNSIIKKFILLKNKVGDRTEETEKNKAINIIIYRFLSEIRYLFKSSDYAFENELRVIQYATPTPDEKRNIIKIDAGVGLPKRLYIESNKPIRPYITKIILGPKVSNPQQWMYLEALMKMKGHQIELRLSECKFQ